MGKMNYSNTPRYWVYFITMFNPSREAARQFFFDAWQHYQQKMPLSALEDNAVSLLLQHPEYHSIMNAVDAHRERDYPPEWGETNPFLHLSLHLALQEQLAIDQPAGVVKAYTQLLAQHKDEHATQHIMMECIAEMLWRAQRERAAPDAKIYFACIAQNLRA